MNNLIFKELDVSKELLRAISDMGFEEATPVQSQSILHILNGRDVLAQAPTGTGKTCAFGIPIVEMTDGAATNVEALVLCPTRELVLQTTEELKKLCKFKRGVKIVPIYGGQPIDRQIFALKRKPQIIVATPGRLMDHLRRHTIRLDVLKHIVLDEADEMLNMGFREDIDTILQTVPAQRQTTLFSATLSKEIMDITRRYQTDAEQIKVTPKEITVPTIEQYYLEIKAAQKIDVLTRLIDTNSYKLSIVFCNTKRMVDELNEQLLTRGYRSAALHGDIKQTQRDKVMNKFRKGIAEILVATDVAARGIDVDNVEAVFNYDLPDDEEYYVHRIGRTGRANKTGVSYSFVSGRQMYQLRDIMRYTNSKIKLMKAPDLSDVEETRTSAVFRELSHTIKRGGLERYAQYIELFLEEDESEITTMDVAAALLSQKIKPAQLTTVVTEERSQKRGGNEEDDGSVRLFLNIGTLDKIQNRNLFDLFKLYTQMDIRDISNIHILDKYSFINVPEQDADGVIEALNGVEYKTRTLAVEKAAAKSSKPARASAHRGPRRGDDKGYSHRKSRPKYS